MEANQNGDDLYVWNGIDSSIEKVEDLKEAIDYAKNYIDKSEGIHPDIESLELFKKVGTIEVTETGQYNGVSVCKVKLFEDYKKSKNKLAI